VDRSKLLEFLGVNGLSVAEYQILLTIGHGPHPAERLAELAAWGSKQSFGRNPSVSESECSEAITSLFSKGLLQVIDATSLAKIESEIAANPAVTLPGLPELGYIDFTEKGGSLCQMLRRELFDSEKRPAWGGYGELNDSDGTFRFDYLAETDESVREASASDLVGTTAEIVSIQGPDPIGAWRRSWWDVIHPHGFRMIIITRPE